MSFVAEDGTGLANAVSFGTVEQARAYADARGLDLAEADADLERHLTLATSWIVAQYSGLWLGEALTITQALPFPRVGIYSTDKGTEREVMPGILLAATFELAAEAARGALYYRPDPTQRRVTERTIGPLTTKFAAPDASLYVALYNFANVRLLLAPLTRDDRNGLNRRGMSVRADRG